MPVEHKLNHLVAFVAPRLSAQKIIVFVLTCAQVEYFSTVLSQLSCLPRGFVMGLHGKMTPKRRNAIYSQFISKSSGLLLCTDVAARGLDFQDIDWCIQVYFVLLS